MNPNEQFGKLHPWQLDIVKLLTEGFDEPAQPMYLPLPRSEGAEEARERFLDAVKEFTGKPITTVWVDELSEVGVNLSDLGADGVIVLDSMSELFEWKIKANRPIPNVIKRLEDEFHTMCRGVILDIARERPHVAMNNWRNNRGGKKHR